VREYKLDLSGSELVSVAAWCKEANNLLVIYKLKNFLTSALVRGEWSTSRPDCFTPGEWAPGTHWIGGWVNPRTGLDDVERRKSYPYRDSNSDPSAVQPLASRYIDCTIPAPHIVTYSRHLWLQSTLNPTLRAEEGSDLSIGAEFTAHTAKTGYWFLVMSP
jgi:hypothetical protein